MKKALKTAALLVAASACILAAQERFDLKVRNYFFSGFAGDSASLATGMRLCEEELSSHPKNAEAMVWHGSGLYFQAGAAFRTGDSQKGMELLQRGLKEMDEAVAVEPDRVGVRIPRGAALFAGSRLMPDAEMAKSLLTRAVTDYQHSYDLQAGVIDQMALHPKGELLIGLADGYSRLGNQEEAAKWFTMIREKLKGTAYAKSADAWFANKSLTPQQAGCLGCHAK
jgi:hypothetical protein